MLGIARLDGEVWGAPGSPAFALVDTVPDTPAPLIDLLERGDRAHRRRKARVATAVAAAAVVIIAVIATATLGGRANDPGPAIDSTGTVPDPEGAAQRPPAGS